MVWLWLGGNYSSPILFAVAVEVIATTKKIQSERQIIE